MQLSLGHNDLRKVPDMVVPLLRELRLNGNKINTLQGSGITLWGALQLLDLGL